MQWKKAIVFTVTLLFFHQANCEDESKLYRGKYIGKINKYHHEVEGEMYAIDDHTLLLVDFTYDGGGHDTFFWAGATNNPGPQGFIIPDEYGRTNVLQRYQHKDFTLALPEKKKISELKWIAIYDINTQHTFGDISIEESFIAPEPATLSPLVSTSQGVSSESIVIEDASTIKIPKFFYNGKGGQTFFWIGPGQTPSRSGLQVPDEYGYLDPLREYDGQDLVIQLPGGKTFVDKDATDHNKFNWFSIFDMANNISYGHISIPEELNVPPSLIKTVDFTSAYPSCIQLHQKYQVSWEIHGFSINIQLIGQVASNEYMSFGISGSDEKSQMEGADVVVAFIKNSQRFAVDYNISALAPCAKILGQYKGVCRDELVGGLPDTYATLGQEKDGITTISYQRSLISADSGDKEFLVDKPIYVVWAIGRLDENDEPGYHDFHSRSNLQLSLKPLDTINTCYQFSQTPAKSIGTWDRYEIFDSSLRTFKATIGPSGGRKGYQGLTGQSSAGLAWYLNGFIIPELYLQRGITYNFEVYGGNNPHSPNLYNPFIITNESHGGYDRLSDSVQKRVIVLAGVEFTRRGRPRPTSSASGPLCLSKVSERTRLPEDYSSFKSFNRTLLASCELGDKGVLSITPNSSWPDTVYYHSFTHANMGWKIHILDSYQKGSEASLNKINFMLFVFISLFIII